MKKFITIWIGCSLALAVGALAQQEEAQPTPTKKQHKAKSAHAAQPSAGQPGQQAPPAGPHPGKQAKGHAAAPNHPHAHTPATNPHAQSPATNPHAQAPATGPDRYRRELKRRDESRAEKESQGATSRQ